MNWPTPTLRNILSNHQRRVLESTTCLLALLLTLNISAIKAEDPTTDESGERQMLAASVNGVPIKLDELAPQVEAELNKYKKYGIRRQDHDLLKALRKQALEQLISFELLYQEASKIEINDLDERVADRLNELKAQHGEKEDFNEQRMRKILTKKIQIDEYLVRNKLKDSTVPESYIKAYYEKHKESFQRKESVRTRHILVSVGVEATAEEKAAAHNKIEEARKLILDGKPFADIARSYSDCNSASNGGELGYQERGYMPPAYDNVAFSLASGEMSNILKTEFGYHILEVIDHKSAGIQPYDEVKDFIARYLNIEHGKKAMNDYLSVLRKKAKIDIYL